MRVSFFLFSLARFWISTDTLDKNKKAMTRHESTPPTKSGIITAKKNSDTKNNRAWKNRIREACLNRVRRQQHQQQQQHDDDDRTMMMMMTHTNADSYMDSRLLVEAELKLHGVLVVSPPNKSHGNSQPQEQQQQQSTVTNMMMMMDCGGESLASNDDEMLVMTEDEVFDLMEEIEREWKQHQEKLLEEEMDRIENEEQALYETIADYEREEEGIDDGDGPSDAVLCPLCQEANLTTSHCSEMGNDIVCPNHMDGSCALRLEARSGLDLSSLKERLAQTILSHAEICTRTLTFQMSHEYTSEDCHLSLLWGTCSTCGTRSCVA